MKARIKTLFVNILGNEADYIRGAEALEKKGGLKIEYVFFIMGYHQM